MANSLNIIVIAGFFALFLLGSIIWWTIKKNNAQSEQFGNGNSAEDYSKLQMDFALSKQTNESLVERLGELNGVLEEQKEKINATSQDIIQLTAKSAELDNSQKEKKEQLDELKLQLSNLQSKLDSANTKISEFEADRREQIAIIQAEKEKNIALIKQFDEQKAGMKDEFKALSEEILKVRQEDLKKQNDVGVKALLEPLEAKITSFQDRVNKVHDETLKGNTALEAEIKNVMAMGIKMRDEATNLTSALKGKSQGRGAWGEAQLERTLQMSGLLEDTHYEYQKPHTDDEGSRKYTDFLIKLPRGKNIIIDSKVTLIAYDKAVNAEDDEQTAIALDEHVKAVKRHIDDLETKNYSDITGLNSPDFVLMFMPIEPAYIEALKHDKTLYNYGFDRNIILVSHTTLIPVLRTVANLWMIDKSNAEAREISDKAGEIYNTVCVVAERLDDLGKSLNTASKHYNSTVTALSGQQGLQGKVSRFTEISKKANKEMKKLEHKHMEFDTSKLTAERIQISDNSEEEPAP